MRLKELREDKDIKQQEIARMLKIATNTYCNYENEKRIIPYDCIIKLAEFYNTSVDYILEVTDDKRPYKKKNKLV